MKYFYLLLTLLIATHSFGQWNKLPQVLNSTLYDMDALNENDLYAVGTARVSNNANGMIFHSKDGGASWDTVYHTNLSPPSQLPMLKVEVIDTNIVYATSFIPFLYKSVDGGGNWDTTKLHNQVGGVIDAMCFMDADTGIVGSFGGEIFKTTDGGLNWNRMNFSPASTPVFDIDCPTNTTCYARTSMPFKLMKSIDGGDTWASLPTAPNTFLGGGMDAINKDTLILVTSDALIFRSVDGGMVWDTIPSPVFADFRDVQFIDNVGYAVGTKETIIKSVDYGATWTVENMDTSSRERINSIHMISSTAAVACSDLGSIYQLDIVNSLDDSPFEKEAFSIFPNPFSDQLTIDFSTPKSGLITVYDIQGKLIRQIEINHQKSISIDLSQVPANLLTVSFLDADTDVVSTKRIVRTGN